jgi:hypothetical protein
MRTAVNLFVRLCVASALPALLVAGSARGEGSGQQGADRFVPSLLVKSGVTGQVWDASLRSEICEDCTFPNAAAAPLRPSDEGDDFAVTPFVGGSLELMTPELSLPGSPRFFIGAEFGGAFGVDRKIAREGDPGTITSPIPGSGQTGFDEATALGQGSETIATMGDYLYGAHLGVAFPFELLGRALRVRTSVAWLHYEVDVEGIVTDAECTPRPAPVGSQCNPLSPTPIGQQPGFLRPISLRASDTGEFDGIGPGIDVELDTGRFGPVGSSILVGAAAYGILADRSVDFSSPTVTISDQLGTDQHVAHFGFEADPWIYRLSVGFRLQWLGFGEE